MKQFKLKNEQTLIIRKAVETDARELIDYVNKVAGETDFLTFGENELGITVEKEEAILKDYLESENKIYLIAEIQGEIVGSLNFGCGVRERTKHTGVFGVSVTKRFWGLGIGKELINYMIDWAKENKKIKKINLRVREDNETAIKLYERLGFKAEGVVTMDFYVKGQYYSSLLMGMEI